MKNFFNLLLVFPLAAISLNSCSSSDDDNNSQLDNKYAKKWYIGEKYFTLSNGNSCENNYYNLKSNGSIEYKFWTGSSTCEHDYENGSWRIDGNKLIREFPSDPGTNNGITMQDEIISVTENELKLKDLSDGSIETYYNYQ